MNGVGVEVKKGLFNERGEDNMSEEQQPPVDQRSGVYRVANQLLSGGRGTGRHSGDRMHQRPIFQQPEIRLINAEAAKGIELPKEVRHHCLNGCTGACDVFTCQKDGQVVACGCRPSQNGIAQPRKCYTKAVPLTALPCNQVGQGETRVRIELAPGQIKIFAQCTLKEG